MRVVTAFRSIRSDGLKRAIITTVVTQKRPESKEMRMHAQKQTLASHVPTPPHHTSSLLSANVGCYVSYDMQCYLTLSYAISNYIVLIVALP